MKKVISVIFKVFGWTFIVLFVFGIITIPVRIKYGIPNNIVGTLLILGLGLGFRSWGDKLGRPKVKEDDKAK